MKDYSKMSMEELHRERDIIFEDYFFLKEIGHTYSERFKKLDKELRAINEEIDKIYYGLRKNF